MSSPSAPRVALVEAPMPPRRPDDLAGRPVAIDEPPAPAAIAMVAAPVPASRPSELVVAAAAPAGAPPTTSRTGADRPSRNVVNCCMGKSPPIFGPT